jgi:glycosyltransferase involved in cell wall biosynthesis
VAFKGFLASLHPALTGSAMREEMQRRGIELVIDAVDYRGVDTDGTGLRWGDYSDVDLVLAIRAPTGTHTDKPASKLYNAWRGGVPALLGPEPAFRELYTDALDYIEVSSPAEALAAIDRLRAEPDLYRRMVERGLERALEFSVEAVLERWIEVLWRRIPQLADERPWVSFPAWMRPALRKAGALLEGRPSR